MFQVVGVFPDVQGEDWLQAYGQWIVLVWEGDDFQRSGGVPDEPGEAGTELPEGGCFHLTIPVVFAAEGFCHFSGKWLTCGSHQVKVHFVVVYAAAIVPDGCAQFFRQFGKAGQQFFQSPGLVFRSV